MRQLSRTTRTWRRGLSAGLVLLGGLAGTTAVHAQSLGTFAVLAGSTVTNTGPSVIGGNIGLSPGTSITGFPPGTIVPPYAIYQTDGVAARAQADLTTAYNVLAARPSTANLSGQDLGGMVLAPGVYSFDTTAQLTGTVTLDGGGDPNATFVFNVNSALTTAANSVVLLTNGAVGANVYFRVGSSATLDSTTTFRGKILAMASITLITGATINCGAALARTGAVTLDTNVINICPAAPVVVGGGLDDIFSGGVLPLGFVVLGLLTPEELERARAELRGEIGAVAGLAGMQAMTSFLSLAGNNGGPNALRAGSPPNEPATVSVMGYASTPLPAGGSAFADFRPGAQSPYEEALWRTWASVYGGYSLTTGDPAAGTHDRTIRNYGFAAGTDYDISDTAQMGFAVGVAGADFALPGTLGTGHSNIYQVAVTGRTEFGDAFVSGTAAYAYNDVTTDRYVTIAGIDHFSAHFGAHDFAAELRTGYRIGAVTPFAAVSGGAFYTPAYSETTVSGASTFALDYRAHTALTARTELGAMLDLGTAALDNGTTANFRASAAWAYDFGDASSTQAGFQALPGTSFTVAAAMASRSSILLSAESEVHFDTGVTLAGSLNGSLSQNSRAYGATIKLGYRW